MLTKLLPDQISKFWDIIKFAIEGSLPPTVTDNPSKMNHILSALLSGKAQCWASYEKSGDSRQFDGIVVTQITVDNVSATKNLLLYCLYGYNTVSENSWRSGFDTLAKWGKSKGCARFVGYTDNPRIVEIVKMFGGEAKYTFISIPFVK